MGTGRIKRNRIDPKLCSAGNKSEPRVLTAKDGKYIPHPDGELVHCRKWQVLPGSYRFFWDGRIVTGPGTPLWLVIQMYFLLTFILFVSYK